MSKILTAIVTQTPMRITLGGGGTDVIWYSKLKGGAWISAAIDKYVYVRITNSLKSHSLHIFDNETEAFFENRKELDNPIIKECLKLVQIDGGLEISTQSDVSPKSGLGGSGAFEVGLLNALHIYKNNPKTPLDLAKEAAKIEIQNLKKPVGVQDQYITALGGINYFEIDKKGNVRVEPLHLSEKAISTLQNNLLFFQTGIFHDTAAVLGDQKSRIRHIENNQITKSLDQIKKLGQLVKKYLLSDRIDDFGKTLHEHWLIKKRLSKQVSNSKIDEWYEQGIKNGALGGKIMGSGGGGWFMFYVNKNHQQFIEKMSQIGLTHQKVSFNFTGTQAVDNFKGTQKNTINQEGESSDEYISNYLGGVLSAVYQLNKEDLKNMILKLQLLKKNKGRLFLLGVGGAAANCSHAVNDFRKIAGIESYAPTDNVSELTARTNDDGWETVFVNWLKVSNLKNTDAVMVFSVGGGNLEKNISANIVKALDYTREVKSMILGIVSRDGGYTKKVADVCVMVPVIKDEFITPFAESFQALIWHLIVFSPQLREIKPY